MDCRPQCGACCIAPSIAAALPGMPEGKPAGVPCVHLDAEYRCELFGDPRRPELCDAFTAEPAVCGVNRFEAMERIAVMELASTPDA